MRHNDRNDRYKAVRQAGLLTTIPALLVVAPLVGFFIGRFLDRRFGTDPVLTIVFLILGFVAAARQIASILRAADRDSGKRKNGK